MLRAIEQAAERGAKRATNRAMKQFLLTLGINAETAAEMQESQKDAAFTRRVRLASESAPGRFGVLFIGAMLTFFGGLVTLGIKMMLNKFGYGV